MHYYEETAPAIYAMVSATVLGGYAAHTVCGSILITGILYTTILLAALTLT